MVYTRERAVSQHRPSTQLFADRTCLQHFLPQRLPESSLKRILTPAPWSRGLPRSECCRAAVSQAKAGPPELGAGARALPYQTNHSVCLNPAAGGTCAPYHAFLHNFLNALSYAAPSVLGTNVAPPVNTIITSATELLKTCSKIIQD